MARVDVLMTEYRDLRSEIIRLSTVQQLILGLSLVVAVAMVPIYAQLRTSGSLMLVVVPYVFTIAAWLHLSQDMTIISTATYLHRRLRPAIVASLAEAGEESDLLGWEAYQGEGRHRDRLGPVMVFTWAMRCLAVMGPAVVFTIWGAANLAWRDFGWLEQILAVGLVAGHAVLLAGVAVLTRGIAPGYRSIAGRPVD